MGRPREAWGLAGLALPDYGLLSIRDCTRLAVGGGDGETRKDTSVSESQTEEEKTIIRKLSFPVALSAALK